MDGQKLTLIMAKITLKTIGIVNNTKMWKRC